MDREEINMTKKKGVKQGLTKNTLVLVSVFFMLFAVLITLLYYRQVADVQAFIKLQNQQRNTLLLVAPSPKAVAPLKSR